MSNFAIVTNTHSSNRDLWEAHFGLLEKYFDVPIYAFSDINVPNISTILYNSNDKFRTQYLSCIKQVKEDVVLYLNEDYLLYDRPGDLKPYIDLIGKKEVDFIRLAKGIDEYPQKVSDTLWFLDPRNPCYFSQTATLWNREALQKLHEEGPNLHIAGINPSEQFEVMANQTAIELGLKGYYHYNGENKRGMAHYDSDIFPYVASALVKGKWNLKEYPQELSKISSEYNINLLERKLFI